jgi:hypothetical protein
MYGYYGRQSCVNKHSDLETYIEYCVYKKQIPRLLYSNIIGDGYTAIAYKLTKSDLEILGKINTNEIYLFWRGGCDKELFRQLLKNNHIYNIHIIPIYDKKRLNIQSLKHLTKMKSLRYIDIYNKDFMLYDIYKSETDYNKFIYPLLRSSKITIKMNNYTKIKTGTLVHLKYYEKLYDMQVYHSVAIFTYNKVVADIIETIPVQNKLSDCRIYPDIKKFLINKFL